MVFNWLFFLSLKCRYLTETHPFLKLAPLKLEQLYLDPDVALLYDVMTDGEIEVLKKCAKPNVSGRTRSIKIN